MSYPPWFSILLTLSQIFDVGTSIYFGRIAEEGQFNYLVSIGVDDHRCGGAILDDYHILTAAHCVDCFRNQVVQVVAGVADLCSPQRLTRQVKTIYIHHNYRDDTKKRCLMRSWTCVIGSLWQSHQNNDIAVLKLAEALPLGGPIMKVGLPSDSSLPYCLPIPYAGWGITERGIDSALRFVELKIATSEPFIVLYTPSREDEFDAYDPTRKSHTGHGDSGSPLVKDNIVYGITTSGTCAPGGITTFTRVHDHLRFIQDAMSDVL